MHEGRHQLWDLNIAVLGLLELINCPFSTFIQKSGCISDHGFISLALMSDVANSINSVLMLLSLDVVDNDMFMLSKQIGKPKGFILFPMTCQDVKYFLVINISSALGEELSEAFHLVVPFSVKLIFFFRFQTIVLSLRLKIIDFIQLQFYNPGAEKLSLGILVRLRMDLIKDIEQVFYQVIK